MFIREHHYKGWISISVIMGTVTIALSITSVNIALPQIMTSFDTSIDKIKWVLMAFIIVDTIMMPLVGWLGGMMGNRNLYMAGMVIFTIASIFCGFSWNIDSLIVFRILQGIGSGPLLPVGIALLYQAYPPQDRGLAMGIYSISWVFGPAIGPAVGGYLVEHFSWRSIFYFNLPVGLVTVIMALIFLPKEEIKEKKTFDGLGLVTMAVFLTTLLLALSQGQKKGWDSSYIFALLGIVIVSLWAFIKRELVTKEPLVELNLYENLAFSIGSIISFIRSAGFQGTLFLVSFFLQKSLHYTPFGAGVLLIPGALAMGITGPLSGKLSDKLDPRTLIMFGLVIVFLVLYSFSSVDLLSSTGFIVLLLSLHNFGHGCINAPLIHASLKELSEEKVTLGAGLTTLVRGVGGAFGVALTGTILERGIVFHKAVLFPFGHHNPSSVELSSIEEKAVISAYHDCFFLIAILFLVTLFPSLFLRKSSKE